MSAVLKVRRSMGDPFELRIQDRTSHNRTQQWHSVSIDGGLKEGWSGSLAPYRQLPVFGRLAYLERAEATKHDRPRRRSPSCPAAVLAAVGTIRGASKLGGRNITEYLQPRNRGLREVVIRRTDAGSRPVNHLGKADDTVEETGESTRCTAGVGDPASKERFSEITSGSCRGQQGTGNNLQGLSNETKNRRRREPNGSGA